MDSNVLSTLEYPKIREMLAAKTSSLMGRELAENLLPSNDWDVVLEQLDETDEARQALLAAPSVPLGGIRDIRPLIKRADIGAVLEPSDLLAVANTLYAARRMKAFISEQEKPLLLLKRVAEGITILRSLEIVIENTVTEQGVVRDDASPELARLRREIRNAQVKVKEKLDHLLHSSEYQKYFQDALVTIRGDRYVIPVKQEYRHQFPGIVHDQSSSGATVFIEPMAVVNINNDIKQAMAAERNEVERILSHVSAQVGQVADALQENCQALAQLDFAFAKARLSLDMHAERPAVNDQGYIKLIDARHPLIPAEVVVPIDVHLGRQFNTLLVTGPNTGGKTVSLKTVGLFSLMTQAGLFIPAKGTSEMTIFRNIYADIGDEQSIEHSLSTFSAHMTNLVRILRSVNQRDLVLIDEIGSGTDPGEGAALAMAVIEYLHGLGVRTIATTHYSELKTFAYARAGVENASVEFDVATLRPTYRLLIGVPGSSNAFNISQRLGLDKKIIDRAREFVDKDHVQFEQVLTALDEKQRDYAKRHAEVEALQQEITDLRNRLRRDKEELDQKRRDIVNKAQEQAAAMLRQARREAEAVITDLKAQFSVTSERERQNAITGARKRLQAGMSGLRREDSQENDLLPPVKASDLEPGAMVFVTTLGQKGSVIAVTDDQATVQLGIMKVNVPLTNCRLVEETSKNTKVSAKRDVNLAKVQQISTEIDLRGLTVSEAEELLDKYLDDAVLGGLNAVRVIHGKGTGALRKGIRSYLASHHHVKDIRFGDIGEGGDGVTVAKLV